jgi:hypothetical protein
VEAVNLEVNDNTIAKRNKSRGPEKLGEADIP